MSDAPTPDHSEAVPSAEELKRTAIPAAIRHAPRLGRFLGTGIGLGVLLGIVLGLALPNSTGAGRGIVVILLSAGFALIGGLVGGVIAIGFDGPVRHKTDQPLFPQDAARRGEEASTDTTNAPDASVTGTPHDRSNGETT